MVRGTKISVVRSLDTKTFSLKVQYECDTQCDIMWNCRTLMFVSPLRDAGFEFILTELTTVKKSVIFSEDTAWIEKNVTFEYFKWPIWELYSTELHHFWAQLNNDYEWNGISMQFQIIFQWHHPKKLIIIKILSQFLYVYEVE